MQRVVAEAGVQPNLEVVVGAARTRQDVADLMAEIPFDFEDKATDFVIWILRAPAQELFNVRVHACGGLSRANGSENHDAGVEAALRNREPCRLRCGPRCRVVMRLAQDERGGWACLRFRIPGQRARGGRRRPSVRDDGGNREHERCGHERRAEPERRVPVHQGTEDDRFTQRD